MVRLHFFLSQKEEAYSYSVTTPVTSSGASMSVGTSEYVRLLRNQYKDTCTHTHALQTSQTALSSTCLQRCPSRSLKGSQSPTLSAHVNCKITGHAQTHICCVFWKGNICLHASNTFIFLLIAPPLLFVTNPENKAGKVQRQNKGKEIKTGDRLSWWTYDIGKLIISLMILRLLWTSPQWLQTTSLTEVEVSWYLSFVLPLSSPFF